MIDGGRLWGQYGLLKDTIVIVIVLSKTPHCFAYRIGLF